MELLHDSTSDSDAPELLPARMLNELVYCPRLFYLEWVQGEWAESEDTLAGSREHGRVDRETGELPPADELAGSAGFSARSVLLSAPGEGLIARMDVLEGGGGEVVPVDYKHGRPPSGAVPVWDADRIQIGVQALVLRENGYRCERGIVYYVAARRRVELAIDEALVSDVRAARDRALALAASPLPPAPLVDSPKCPRCSLVGICLPDEHNRVTGLADSGEHDVRLLFPARDDALPVYVQAQGAFVGKSGDELEIREQSAGQRRVRLIDCSQLCVFGSVQVSAGAIAALLERGVPICHFSFGGWFRGITHGLGSRNCALRLHQYRVASDATSALALARGFVARKIRNCRTLLRRNAEDLGPSVLDELERSAARAEVAESTASLLGIEGMAARTYFGSFAKMLSAKAQPALQFEFDGRNRRPPLDPINALLSLAYSAVARDWTVTLLSVGLDPYLGLFHRPRFGRPALALDLMEEFRPLVADSVVIQVLNNGEVQPGDFIRRGPAVALTPAGRRKFFLAYERRLGHIVRHPVFGYRVSYRRLFEVQARLLARHLSGEVAAYDGFRTR